jgi:hypothetical protein
MMEGEVALWIGAIVVAIVLMLWLQHQSERQGVDTRGWRVTWTVFIIVGCIGIYFLLT